MGSMLGILQVKTTIQIIILVNLDKLILPDNQTEYS